VQSKVEIADQTHPSDTIVAGDFGVVRRVTFSDGVVVRPSMSPGKKSAKVSTTSAQEQAQVQRELEEGG